MILSQIKASDSRSTCRFSDSQLAGKVIKLLMYIMPLSIKNSFKKQFIYLLVFQQLAGRRLSGLLPAGW